VSPSIGSIKCLDKILLKTSPLGEITSPHRKGQAPTSKIKDALQAYQKLVSPLKLKKHEIKKHLDFLNYLATSIAMKQNVDTDLNTLIYRLNEDCGATTSSLSKDKNARLTDNDEQVANSPAKKIKRTKIPITMRASVAKNTRATCSKRTRSKFK